MSDGPNLLLVTPPARGAVYQRLRDVAAIEPPVWSGLIATYMRARGYRVQILDAEAHGLDVVQTAESIVDFAPEIAAFSIYGHQPSASTQCMPAAIEVVDQLPDKIRTVAFGTHPSALPAATLEDSGFDFVAKGEAVMTIEAMLVALRFGANLRGLPSHLTPPGLWWVKDDAVFHSSDAPLVQDLDRDLPGQSWDLLTMRRYRAHNWHRWGTNGNGGYASVQTSLGCPFKCSFCCINAPFGGPGYRTWSPRNIANQLFVLLDQYGISNVKIPDEMFVLNKAHVEGVCREIIKWDIGQYLNIWAYARVDTVKDEGLLALMRKAGFRWLGIGVESGSKHVRDGVEKGRFGDEDIRRAIERVRNAGIYVGANYIFGLPDDTADSMQATLDLACSLNTEYANFYCAMAYPGSALHKQARERGWRLPEDPGGPGWIGYSQHAYESLPLRTEALTTEQVLDFRDAAFMRYFTRPEYLDMMRRTFSDAVVAEVQAMTALGMPRRAHRNRRSDGYDMEA